MQTQNDIIKSQTRCIAHEIRNQLSICDVYCEIIKKHLDKNGIELPPLNNAVNCILKSLKMIDNSLLDLKSLSNVDCKDCNLKQLLCQAVELGKVYIYDKNIDVLLDVPENCTVYVDENKFLACVINLIKNGVEAIETEGFISIKTEILKDFVSIRIANSGDEIPEEFRNKIFDEGLTTKSFGSGLGLFICKNNLKSMGADLNLVKSSEEITEFEVTLPIKKS